MENYRRDDMQTIFNALSEQNKDIVILVAKSVQVAQEAAKQPLQLPKSNGVTLRGDI